MILKITVCYLLISFPYLVCRVNKVGHDHFHKSVFQSNLNRHSVALERRLLLRIWYLDRAGKAHDMIAFVV